MSFTEGGVATYYTSAKLTFYLCDSKHRVEEDLWIDLCLQLEHQGFEVE